MGFVYIYAAKINVFFETAKDLFIFFAKKLNFSFNQTFRTMKRSEMLDELIETFANGNKSRFSRLVGITPQTLTGWYLRESMDKDSVYKACAGVSAHWLLTDGDGEMLNDGAQAATPAAPSRAYIQLLEGNVADLRATITEQRHTIAELRERLALAEGKNASRTA